MQVPLSPLKARRVGIKARTWSCVTMTVVTPIRFTMSRSPLLQGGGREGRNAEHMSGWDVSAASCSGHAAAVQRRPRHKQRLAGAQPDLRQQYLPLQPGKPTESPAAHPLLALSTHPAPSTPLRPHSSQALAPCSPQRLAHNGVQRPKGLVQQHQARVAGQRTRHGHALPLPARQLRRVAAAQALQPRQLQQLLNPAGAGAV